MSYHLNLFFLVLTPFIAKYEKAILYQLKSIAEEIFFNSKAEVHCESNINLAVAK